jgi:hypothetical protein
METTLYLLYLQATCMLLVFSMMMMEMEERARAARHW